jgi:hypothetical protein
MEAGYGQCCGCRTTASPSMRPLAARVRSSISTRARSAARALCPSGSGPYRAGRSAHWLKIKNPAAPAVRRETEEDWGGRRTRRKPALIVKDRKGQALAYVYFEDERASRRAELTYYDHRQAATERCDAWCVRLRGELCTRSTKILRPGVVVALMFAVCIPLAIAVALTF